MLITSYKKEKKKRNAAACQELKSDATCWEGHNEIWGSSTRKKQTNMSMRFIYIHIFKLQTNS